MVEGWLDNGLMGDFYDWLGTVGRTLMISSRRSFSTRQYFRVTDYTTIKPNRISRSEKPRNKSLGRSERANRGFSLRWYIALVLNMSQWLYSKWLRFGFVPIDLRFVKARFSHSGPHRGLDPLSGSLDLMADLLQQPGLVARPIGIDFLQQLLMVYSYQVLESRVCIWV